MALVSTGGRPTGEVLRKRELLLMLLFEMVRPGEALDRIRWPSLAYLAEWFECPRDGSEPSARNW